MLRVLRCVVVWAGKAAMLRLSVTMSDGSVHNVSSTSTGGWTATTAANPVVYSHLFHVSPRSSDL